MFHVKQQTTFMIQKQREVSLDLLRIFAMFLIVLQHMLDFIGCLTIKTFNISHIYIYFFETFSLVAVDVFVLITGFFLIKKAFEWQKLFSLLFEVAFFSWIILIISKLFGVSDLSHTSILNYIFPTLSGTYWFITAYIMLYLFFPFINRFIYSLTEKQLKIFAALILFIYCIWGYNFNCKNVFWLSVIYCWGASIRLFIEDKKKNFLFLPYKMQHNIYYLIFYVLCSILVATICIYYNIKGKQFVNIIKFNNLFVFMGSVYLFTFAYKFKFTTGWVKKIILFVAPASLGVYLVHMHPIILYKTVEILRNIKTPPYQYLSLNILFFSTFLFLISLVVSIVLHKTSKIILKNFLLPCISNIIKKYSIKNDQNTIS